VELVVIAAVVFVVVWLLRRGSVAPHGAYVGPVAWAQPTEWRVVRPLTRADTRRVLRHPAFVAGVLLTPLTLLAATETESSWFTTSTGIALGLVPLGWLAIVAVNLVALRPRRTGADELFGSLPAPQSTRSTALLASAIGPAIVASVLAVGAVVVLAATRGDELSGAPQWGEIATGILIVAGGACVGVAVARWLPRAGFGTVAVAVVILLQVRFLDVKTWPWNSGEADPARFLGFLAAPTTARDQFLEVRPAGWHLLYLGGLVVVMAAITLAREGMRRPVAALLAVGVVVTAGTGWLQTRPISEEREDAIVAYLTEPRAHYACDESGGVEYCAYPAFVGDVDSWRARVEATIARLPAAALEGRRPLRVAQRPAIVASDDDCTPRRFLASLPAGVAARLSPGDLWPADGQVHPPFEEESFPCSERDVHGFFLAVQTGAWGVGLPPTPARRDTRCTAPDQARAAIALWAAAASTPDGARTLRDVADEAKAAGKSRISFAGWDDPPMLGVEYSVADARVALALLKIPSPRVRATLERDWDRWIDPATSTATLAAELGVGVGGGPESRDAGGTRCP
jgi:hypothetical protein